MVGSAEAGIDSGAGSSRRFPGTGPSRDRTNANLAIAIVELDLAALLTRIAVRLRPTFSFHDALLFLWVMLAYRPMRRRFFSQ